MPILVFGGSNLLKASKNKKHKAYKTCTHVLPSFWWYTLNLLKLRTNSASSDLELLLRQWSTSNVYLLVFSKVKMPNSIAVGLWITWGSAVWSNLMIANAWNVQCGPSMGLGWSVPFFVLVVAYPFYGTEGYGSTKTKKGIDQQRPYWQSRLYLNVVFLKKIIIL